MWPFTKNKPREKLKKGSALKKKGLAQDTVDKVRKRKAALKDVMEG